MSDITFYNQDGMIAFNYSASELLINAMIEKNHNKYGYVSGFFSDSEFYVLNGVATPRPAQDTAIDKTTLIADGVDVAIISNAPNEATISAYNQTTKTRIEGIISGSDTFSTEETGRILIRVEKFPYLPWEAWIDAA